MDYETKIGTWGKLQVVHGLAYVWSILSSTYYELIFCRYHTRNSIAQPYPHNKLGKSHLTKAVEIINCQLVRYYFLFFYEVWICLWLNSFSLPCILIEWAPPTKNLDRSLNRICNTLPNDRVSFGNFKLLQQYIQSMNAMIILHNSTRATDLKANDNLQLYYYIL